MMDWERLFYDIRNGYKNMAIILFTIAICAGILAGFIVLVGLLIGKCSFQWWFIPFWVLDLTMIAGCIGDI